MSTQTRADFDNILLRNAEKSGVRVFEESRALSIFFADNNAKGRPIAAKWSETSPRRDVSGTIAFDYPSRRPTGREGIMAQEIPKASEDQYESTEPLRSGVIGEVLACMVWARAGRTPPGLRR